jgi:hypothetical protein
MKNLILLTITGVFLIANSLFSNEKTEVMTGFIYKQGSWKKDLLYIQKEFLTGNSKNGEISHQYFNTAEELAAFETVSLNNGNINFYETEIRELDFYGSLRQRGDSLEMVRIVKGKEKTKQISGKTNILVGPMLPYFIKDNVDLLLDGEELDFYLPYFDFMTLIHMELEKKSGQDRITGNTMIIEMKIKNPLLKLLVESIEMVINLKNGSIEEIHGPTILPEPGLSNKNKLVNANIFYNYGGSL